MNGSKAVATLAVIALVVVAFVMDMKRREAQQQIEQLSVSMEQVAQNPPEANQQLAKGIVDKVRKLIDIPTDVEPTVATIVDVETLRQRNAFYNKAENGDHLIVTTDRAILYDPDNNVILDVVPVQIQPIE